MMLPVHNPLRRFPISLALAMLLSACANPPARNNDVVEFSVDQRLADLERRLERLENRPPILAPYRNREEIKAQVSALEAERAALLGKYTERHPAVRDIDRRLLILDIQLKMLEP